jgi:hypothetical protein
MFQNLSIRTNIKFIPNSSSILRFFGFDGFNSFDGDGIVRNTKSTTHIAYHYSFFGKGNPNESTPKYEGEVLVYPFNRTYSHYEIIDKTLHYSKINRAKKKYKIEFLNMIRNESL